MNNLEYCASRYFVGMKVEVGIPLPDAKMFRDWAVINELDEDLVSLQLSRDILPDGVSLRVGQILTIRSERDCQVQTCRCFIVSIGYDHELLLRLTSEIFSGESREFYRVDAFLPIKYHRLHDPNLDSVKKQWEARRKWRQEDKRVRELRRLEAMREKQRYEELARELKLLDGACPDEPVELSRGIEQEELQNDQYDEFSAFAKTVAVTISGGGIKITTSQEFDKDEFILLEIFVPSSRIIADVVARVVFSSRDIAGEDQDCFNAGMQFVFIDETARLAINSHLSSIQLKRIRHFKGFTDVEPLYVDNMSKSDKHYAFIDGVGVSGDLIDSTRNNRRLAFRQVALGLFFACVISLMAFYFSGYVVKHPKNEIQKIFDHGITHREKSATPLGGPRREGDGG